MKRASEGAGFLLFFLLLTLWTAFWISLLGDWDSLSSVRICCSPSGRGAQLILLCRVPLCTVRGQQIAQTAKIGGGTQFYFAPKPTM